MYPCSYIPGQPGFQIKGILTSENALMWLRFRNQLVIFKALPSIIKGVKWTKQITQDARVNYPLPAPSKPNYLVLINSFFGLEVSKDIPPLVQAIRPILADAYPPLSEPYEGFLEKHKKTLYLALGTYIILSNNHAAKLVEGLVAAMD